MPHDRTRPWSLVVAAAIGALASAPGSAGALQPNPTGECPSSAPTYRVGYRTESLEVTGTLGETRPIQVHVWYPARNQDDCGEAADFAQGPGGCHAAPAAYTSRLAGVPLVAGWSPLSWTIAGNAFEGARVAEGDERFPVIVFSHGNTVNAIDYAYTLEALASYGYIVAAPDHVNNTQDDVRIDVVNATALKEGLIAPGQDVIACLDGLSSWGPPKAPGQPPVYQPCSRASVPDSMIDRYRDVEGVLDALLGWFGERVDMDRIGILGHSRGTVTALSVAGGSSGTHQIDSLPAPIDSWGRQLGRTDLEFAKDPRIKALMGLAMGVPSIAFAANVQDITVPALLVGGTLDVTSPPEISHLAYTLLASTDKQFLTVQNAVHRHFESGLCAVMQSSGAIAQNDTHAVLDHESARQILQPPSAAHPGSGVAMDFCGLDAFTTPTDITRLARSITGFEVIPFDGVPTLPPASTTVWAVPSYGLTSDMVEQQVIELSVAFFGRVLHRAEGDDRPFSDCLPDAFKNQPPVAAPTQQELEDAEQHADDPD